MPLVDNVPPEQKARIYDFWAAAWKEIGVEPVVTLNPASWLLLQAGTVDMKQVEALRAIAAKYLSFSDRLEAQVKAAMPVVPEDANGNGDEDDMPEPIVRGDGRGGPAPAPVAPRTRTRGR